MANINIRRIETRIGEMFNERIDMSDFPDDTGNHFNTRAIAALTIMMKCGVDATKAGACITDGYHDMGIDALYLDNNQRKLFVVQSKWRNEGTGSISQEEMGAFVEGVKRILNFELEGANAKVAAKKTDIDFGISQIGYQIHLVFVHTGNAYIPDYAKRPLSQLMDATNDDVSTLLLFDELAYKDIYAFLAEGQSSDHIVIDDVLISNWGKIDTPYPAYYGIISAAAIGEWYCTHGNSLFAKNIRFYKGNTDVNSGIKRVLLEEPEMFAYYNNGIKILCQTIERKARGSTTTTTGLFALSGVSLVNGAQTAGAIGEIYASNPEQVAKASVMVQIVDLSNAPRTVSDQITKLSNTQNRIDSKDFASMDPEQERLRTELAFSHIYYLYKSGDVITDLERQITFDEAIIALACLHNDISYSTLAKRNVGGLSEDINKAPYKTLFNPSTNSFALINSVLAMRKIEMCLQTKKEQSTGRERLVYVHANRFITYCVLQLIKNEQEYNNIILNEEFFQSNIQSTIETIVPRVISIINSRYVDSYPANIFKNTQKCRDIYQELIIEVTLRFTLYRIKHVCTSLMQERINPIKSMVLRFDETG